jgi:two-component system, NarL family, invasion response regulator UvrY
MTKQTIALVDDHVMLRHGLASLIYDMDDYTVIAECDNGQDFINAVLQKDLNPDIVLLDIDMPVLNGFATAEWMSQNLPLSKILVLSMYDDERNIIKMIGYGAKGYILKDGEPATLSAALHDVVHNGYHFNEYVSGKLVNAVQNNKIESISINEREKLFLQHCCSELTYKEIGSAMNLSSRTVEGYRDQLFEKLEVKTRTGLVLYAIKNKIVLL